MFQIASETCNFFKNLSKVVRNNAIKFNADKCFLENDFDSKILIEEIARRRQKLKNVNPESQIVITVGSVAQNILEYTPFDALPSTSPSVPSAPPGGKVSDTVRSDFLGPGTLKNSDYIVDSNDSVRIYIHAIDPLSLMAGDSFVLEQEDISPGGKIRDGDIGHVDISFVIEN